MRYRRVTRYVRLVPLGVYAAPAQVLRALAPPVPVAPLRWRPAADICETASSVTVLLDIAGLDEEATDIELYEDVVVVEGERRVESCGPDGLYHVAEIRQGPFRVEIPLPGPVDADRVDATYEHGLLRIELPKAVSRSGARRDREEA